MGAGNCQVTGYPGNHSWDGFQKEAEGRKHKEGTVASSLARDACPGTRAGQSIRKGQVVVQSLSLVQLFAIPWTAACQASLSFTIFWSLPKFMSIQPSQSLSSPALNFSQYQSLSQ